MAEKDFTAREMEIMAKAWNCMTEEPKVDYNKLAELCGMTNPRSASNAWALIKKKIMAKGGMDKEKDGSASPSKPKATPKKRAKKAKAEEDDEEASPAKKQKGRKATAKSEPKVDDEDGDEGGSPVKQEESENEMN